MKCRTQLLSPPGTGCCRSLCSKFTVGSADMQMTADDELHMDALRRHAARAAERNGHKSGPKTNGAARTSRTTRTPVSSRTPSVADVPPTLPATSIDLTHLRANGSVS